VPLDLLVDTRAAYVLLPASVVAESGIPAVDEWPSNPAADDRLVYRVGEIRLRLEGREQLGDPDHEPRGLRRLPELGREQLDVAAAHRLNALLVRRLRVAGQSQQLAHDLRIGLPVEAVGLDRTRRPRLEEQRAMDRPPTRAVGPEQRAVDVEQDELHDKK